MNAKQIILALLAFLCTLFVLTIPLWLDTALPILKDYLNSAMLKLENWYAFLKFISGRIEYIFMRLLERYVLNSH